MQDTCLFDGGGDHDPLDPAVEVRLQLLLGQENALEKTVRRRKRTHREREKHREKRWETVVEDEAACSFVACIASTSPFR